MLVQNITHRDLDGVVCSVLIHDYFRFKEDVEFMKLPCTYRVVDDVFKRYHNSKVLTFITDISLVNESKFPDLEKLENVILIDHHPRETSSKIKKQIVKTNQGAGCKLVFDFFEKKGHKFSLELKKLMELANDYDTWTHKYPFSKQLNRLFYFYNFKDFFLRFQCGIDKNLLENEKKFLVWKQKEVEKLLSNIRFETMTDNVVFVTSSEAVDEIADYILRSNKFSYKFDFNVVIIYNPKVNTLSFRCKKEYNVDLGKFLKLYGGGGHKEAAGIVIKEDSDIVKIIGDFCEKHG